MNELREKLASMKSEGMTEHQITEAMDIRKKGKNKLAAQNCRKKKQNEIEALESMKRCALGRREEAQELHQDLLETLEEWECKLAKLKWMVVQKENLDPDVFELVLVEEEVRFRPRPA